MVSPRLQSVAPRPNLWADKWSEKWGKDCCSALTRSKPSHALGVKMSFEENVKKNYVQDKNRDGIWLNLFELSNDNIQFYSSWRYQILTGSSFPHCWFQWYLLSCRPALAFVMFLPVIFCHCRSSHHLSVTRSRNSLPPGIQHRVSTHSHSQLWVSWWACISEL